MTQRPDGTPDEFRQWTTDADGCLVRVGLTAAETAEYEEFNRRRLLHIDWPPTDEERQRHTDMENRHEFARMAVLAAENR